MLRHSVRWTSCSGGKNCCSSQMLCIVHWNPLLTSPSLFNWTVTTYLLFYSSYLAPIVFPLHPYSFASPSIFSGWYLRSSPLYLSYITSCIQCLVTLITTSNNIDISFCFVRADLMDTFKNPLIQTEVLELVDLLYGEAALQGKSQDEQAKILVQGMQTHYLSATYLSIWTTCSTQHCKITF